MRLRSWAISACALIAGSALILPSDATAQASTGGPTCFGSVGCAGTAVASSCSADAALVEQETAGRIGQLKLYASPVCGTAWATLVIDTSTTYAESGYKEGYRYVAEVFYEDSAGGAEQFALSSPWDSSTTSAGSTLTTPMLPSDASFKACGGAAADDTGNMGTVPFDEDPQGSGGLSEPQLYPGLTTTPTSAPGGPPTDYNGGTCTMWH